MFLRTCAHVILSHEGTRVKLVSTSDERVSSHALENLIDIYCMTEPHLSLDFIVFIKKIIKDFTYLFIISYNQYRINNNNNSNNKTNITIIISVVIFNGM